MESALDVLSRAATMVQDNANGKLLKNFEFRDLIFNLVTIRVIGLWFRFVFIIIRQRNQ